MFTGEREAEALEDQLLVGAAVEEL